MGFKLVSKLSSTKYPCLQTMEEILQWLTFAPNVDPYEIDPVFLGRVGAMARDEKIKHHIISGHRPTSLQEKLYLAKGGVKNPDGTYSDPYGKVNGRVAKPNRSFHEFRLAIDSGTKYYKDINKVESALKQSKLNKYGLFKPLTIGQGIKESGCEDWHIQPIETLDASLEKRRELAPTFATQLLSPYEILQSKSIINKVGFDWEDACENNHQINGLYMKALINNYYKYQTKEWSFTFTQAIQYLFDEKIITNKETWMNWCQPNGKVSGEFAKIVIKRMSEKL